MNRAPAVRRRPLWRRRRRSGHAADGGTVATGSTVAVRFEGIRRPVEFRDCPEIPATLARILQGWKLEAAEPAGGAELAVSRRNGVYRIDAPWLDGPIVDAGAVSTTCSLVVDIVSAYLKDNPALLCLHCGAAMFGGRAVVFPSTNRAGKSTLVARLAAEGLRIVADDLMPVNADGECVALGVAARLRIPLPAGSGQAFGRFVEQHAGPGDGYYQYLELPDKGLASHGERAPFGAIVMLERSAGAPAALEAVPRSEALTALIRQNFARDETAGTILRRLHAVTEDVPAARLRYSDLGEATALLMSTFAAWPPALPADPIPGTRPAGAPRKKRRPTAFRLRCGDAPCGDFVRHPGASSREVDGEAFLSDPSGQDILHLNALGAAIWNLLAEPTGTRSATDTLCLAFPKIRRARVEADVRRIFADLLDAGLLARPPDAAP